MDTHCHLDQYPNPSTIIDEIVERELLVLSVTMSPSSLPTTRRLAENASSIYTGIGFHPHIVADRYHELDLISEYIFSADFVGEIGLDGCPSLKDTWSLQRKVFDRMISEAERHCCRVLSIHSRHASKEVIDVLRPYKGVFLPILHWFSGTHAELHEAIELGCWFSIGPAMVKSRKGLNLINRIPLNRILLETDGPFTSNNGRIYVPWDAEEVCPIKIAEVCSKPLAEINDQLVKNVRFLLNAIDQG